VLHVSSPIAKIIIFQNAILPSLPIPQTLEEKWEKAGIEDAFIFGSVMSSNKDLLLELLQLSLPEMEIEEILDAGQEVHIKTAVDAHGVRLDVSVRDNKGRVFDVEMQLRDESDIPKRIRYYTGTLDQANLKPGESYNQLKDTVVLFITRFDPFNRERRRYTFRNICLEEKDNRLELGDGTTKVILNATGKEGMIPSALKDSSILSWESGRLRMIPTPVVFRNRLRLPSAAAP